MDYKPRPNALFLLFFFLLFFQMAQAQTTYTGCVIYGSNGLPILTTPVYTGATGNTTSCNGYSVEIYSSTPTSANLDTYCSITPALAPASPALFRTCIVGSACGIVKTITVYDCPLDEWVPWLLLVISGAAAFFLKTGSQDMKYVPCLKKKQ